MLLDCSVGYCVFLHNFRDWRNILLYFSLGWLDVNMGFVWVHPSLVLLSTLGYRMMNALLLLLYCCIFCNHVQRPHWCFCMFKPILKCAHAVWCSSSSATGLSFSSLCGGWYLVWYVVRCSVVLLGKLQHLTLKICKYDTKVFVAVEGNQSHIIEQTIWYWLAYRMSLCFIDIGSLLNAFQGNMMNVKRTVRQGDVFILTAFIVIFLSVWTEYVNCPSSQSFRASLDMKFD